MNYVKIKIIAMQNNKEPFKLIINYLFDFFEPYINKMKINKINKINKIDLLKYNINN